MSSRFRLGTAASLLAIVLTVAACGSDDGSSGSAASTSASSSDAKSEPISLALTPSSGAVCIRLADQRGLFKKNNVAIKYVPPAATGAAQIAQILNGQIDAGAGAYTGVIAAASNNLPVVITNAQDEDYSMDGQTAFATVVGKDSGITSFKQLEGKSVAVNSLQGNWEVSLKEAIAKDGGDPSKVKLVAIPFPDQVTALKSGRVDAISTLQPFIAQMTSQGYKSIGDPQAIGFGGKTDSVVDVMFVGKKWAEEHDDGAQGLHGGDARRQRMVQRPPGRGPQGDHRVHEGLAGRRQRDPGAQVHREARTDHHRRLVQAPREVRDSQEGPAQGPGPVVGSA